jgi:SAM-dependent methyltransferase
MVTTSEWGEPSQPYLSFLDFVEGAVAGEPMLTVVGCADGKFVLPAARRGWRVRAIDIDARMIDGTRARPYCGLPRPVAGLRRRLSAERLTERVEVYHDDFMAVSLERSDALWTSGCLQYSCNLHHDIGALTDRLRRLLVPGGYAYIEYMLPDEAKLRGRPNCPPQAWWERKLCERGWQIIEHGLSVAEVDHAHPYMPFAHVHSWGRLLARAKA